MIETTKGFRRGETFLYPRPFTPAAAVLELRTMELRRATFQLMNWHRTSLFPLLYRAAR